jgi:DNA-binding CsgD family transcriptional regulator
MQDFDAFEENDSVKLTVNSYRSLQLNAPKSRRSGAKRHPAWEKIDLESGGIYSSYHNHLAARLPILSPMELRVGALLKGKLQSDEISKRLAIKEKTLENHQNPIRRKLGLGKEELISYLIEI